MLQFSNWKDGFRILNEGPSREIHQHQELEFQQRLNQLCTDFQIGDMVRVKKQYLQKWHGSNMPVPIVKIAPNKEGNRIALVAVTQHPQEDFTRGYWVYMLEKIT